MNAKGLLALVILALSTNVLIGQQWRSLFNGKNLEGWKPVAGSAKFSIEGDAIVGESVYGSPNTFLITEENFGDFILELDLRIDHLTSNSGIMARGQYDPAARDGKGLVYGYQVEADPSARAWSGGIYDEARRDWLFPLELNPAAKPAFKMGQYNHYRIEFIGNVLKTWVNGIPVACLADDMDSHGFIGLQVHSISKPEEAGRKTYFKNIRVQTGKPKPMTFSKDVYVVNNLLNNLTPYEKMQGYSLLFNGKNGDGWVGAYKNTFPQSGWSVKDGVLTIASSDGGESTNAGDIVTKEQFNAFDLSFDFRLTAGANSGVKYFVTLSENNQGSAIGLEYQVLDDALHPDAKMGRDGNRTLASLYDLIKANKQPRFVKPIGQWNKGRVVVYPDNKVEHYINGVKVLEYKRGSQEFRDLVAISKYNVWPNFGEAPKGHILLQDHGNEVSFKNIRIRKL